MLLLKATVLALLALAVNGDQKLMGDDKLMLNESGKGRPGLDHKLVNEAGKPRAGMGRKKRSYPEPPPYFDGENWQGGKRLVNEAGKHRPGLDDKLILNESGKGRPGLDHKLVNKFDKYNIRYDGQKYPFLHGKLASEQNVVQKREIKLPPWRRRNQQKKMIDSGNNFF